MESPLTLKPANLCETPHHLLQGSPVYMWRSFSEQNLKADLCGIIAICSVAFLPKLHKYFLHSFKIQSQNPRSISILYIEMFLSKYFIQWQDFS